MVVQARKALEMFRKEFEDSDDENSNNEVAETKVDETAKETSGETDKKKDATEDSKDTAADDGQRNLRWQKTSYRKPVISQLDDPCLL